MNGIISGFLVVLDYFDIFHFPVTLVLNKKETATTISGKIISSIIIAFVLYSFIVSDLINRTNAQTLSQDLSIKPRSPLYFTSQNFTVAIGVSDVDNFDLEETNSQEKQFFQSITVFTLETTRIKGLCKPRAV